MAGVTAYSHFMKAFREILACFVGLAMVVLSILAWRFWQIDGLVAFLLGAAGVSLIGVAFRTELV